MEPRQSSTTQQPASPSVLKRSPIRYAMLRKLYQCANGVQLTVMQERDAVRVTLSGHIYDLKLLASDDPGTKYTGVAITWSLVGDTGTLQDATDPSNPAILASDCHQQSILPPSSSSPSTAPANVVEGTLNFATPKDLPPAAQIRIQLLDVKTTDERRKGLGVRFFNIWGRKPPIPFELTFDPQDIPSASCCALYAELVVDGKPLFATAHPVPIADMTHPARVTIELEPVKRKAAQP